MRDAIKGITKTSIKGDEPYVHVTRNLYAMPTPLLDGAKESEIEGFFEASVKQTLVDGKTFHTDKDFDASKHYGKKTFAHKVVVPNASAINFVRFVPLLKNMASIIKAHTE